MKSPSNDNCDKINENYIDSKARLKSLFNYTLRYNKEFP